MVAVCEVPGAEPVEQKHPEDGAKKAKKPEQRAGVAEAQVEVAEGRQQQRGEDEGGNLIVVGHG
jgi:hypothetical protein